MTAFRAPKSLTREKIILTDVDGVLLDFHSSATEFLRNEKKIDITYADWDKSYWLYEIINGTPEQDKEIFSEFSQSEYFRNLSARECALKSLKTLAADGWRFVAVTAAGQGLKHQNMNKVLQYRMDNLEKHFGNIFEDIHITNVYDCKSPILKRYDPTWWVEDSVTNAIIGHETGHRSVIMHTRHYQAEKNTINLPVVKGWDEIEVMVNDFTAE